MISNLFFIMQTTTTNIFSTPTSHVYITLFLTCDQERNLFLFVLTDNSSFSWVEQLSVVVKAIQLCQLVVLFPSQNYCSLGFDLQSVTKLKKRFNASQFCVRFLAIKKVIGVLIPKHLVPRSAFLWPPNV